MTSQTNAWLRNLSHQHRDRRARSDAYHQAALVRRARQRADWAELLASLAPDDVITTQMPQVLDPGPACSRPGCGHDEAAHIRGRETPIPCTAASCECLTFKAAWGWRDTAGAVVTVVLWLVAAAVVLGVVAVVIGGAG